MYLKFETSSCASVGLGEFPILLFTAHVPDSEPDEELSLLHDRAIAKVRNKTAAFRMLFMIMLLFVLCTPVL